MSNLQNPQTRIERIDAEIAKIKTSEDYKHWLTSKGVDPDRFLPMLLKTKEQLESTQVFK